MSKWAKVGDAKASGDKLPNLAMDAEVGTMFDVSVRITDLKDVEGRKGDLFFIIAFEVLECDDGYHEHAKPGRQYSQVIKFNNEMGPTNVKRFLLAINGFDPQDEENEDKIDEDDVEYVLSDEGKEEIIGLECDLTIEVIKTQGEGNKFTKHTWHVVEGGDDDDEEDED